jgi:DNA-binding CsgD family transcriptional regulator
VAALAGQALPVVTIARGLDVSPNTAKTHLKAVYGKLGVRSQAELVRLLMSRHPPAGY